MTTLQNCSVSKAYVDTSVLVDALLKKGPQCAAARTAIKRFEITELPTYAIKEFKAGALSNYVWLHNKFATLRSYTKVLNALHTESMLPRRYRTATSLEALRDAASSMGKLTSTDLVSKYGANARQDSIQCDEYRLAIKVAIFKAWRLRRKLTSRVIQPLDCYAEADPFEERGLIVIEPTSCKPDRECCMASDLKSRPSDLAKLKDTLCGSTRREQQRCYKVLRQLIRKPKIPMSPKMCRNMGDAIFAFFAPKDSTILTTNTRDHAPLAAVLGKQVASP